MKNSRRGCRGSILAMALVMVFSLAACDFSLENGSTEPEPEPEPRELTMLHAEGELVKNEGGETVYLRGVNAGGLFVIEQWMNGFQKSNGTKEVPILARDHRTTTQVFLQRFGEEQTKKLWKTYQDNWWSEIDFAMCAEMGMNVIRLPFTYMTVDFDAILSYDDAGKNYDFSALDAFVEKAAEYGMYTILDLHGAYGSQNGQDHSGQTIDSAEYVTFYSNPKMQELTAKLWGALAEHYKDNPAVAGYDILNEPGEKAGETESRHFAVFDKLYRAIREKDTRHMVIFESCWEGENLPHPSEYGWRNCMYSFHHYTNLSQGGQYLEHGTSWNEKIANVARQNFGVPLYMGEFTCYNDAEQWDYCLELMNSLGWHWTSWTYKLNATYNNSAWGIVSIPATNKVNAHTDSYETILEKFGGLRTTENIHKTQLDERTLKEILTQYYTEPAPAVPAGGDYVLRDTVSYNALFTNGSTVTLSEDRNAATPFTLTRHADGDGSVLFRVGTAYLSVLSDRGAVTMSGKATDSSRFYLVQTEYGYAVLSYTTCRYIRLDGDKLYADGTFAQAAEFYLE